LKSIQVLFAVSLITIIVLCSSVSFVSALSQDEVLVSVVWLNQPIRPGDTTSFLITIASTSSDQLTITSVGLHFDWMAEGEYYTQHLDDTPIILPTDSSQVLNPITIQIPPYVTAGSHSYTVAILGTQEASGDLAWESDTKTVNIESFGATATPSTEPTPTNNGGQPIDISLNTIAIIIAVLVVVAGLIAVLLLKRRKPAKPAAASTESQPTTPAPEKKPEPEQKPASPEEPEEKPAGSDFSI
jgi:hypothetical protein